MRIEGQVGSKSAQVRNATAQREAGGACRLPTDERGQFVGRRFDGPIDELNNFSEEEKSPQSSGLRGGNLHMK
jgi:hypothetical protein